MSIGAVHNTTEVDLIKGVDDTTIQDYATNGKPDATVNVEMKDLTVKQAGKDEN